MPPPEITLYPFASTAAASVSAGTFRSSMTTAVPFSWLAVASVTPSTASSAVFTAFSQWAHIMPSIFSVAVFPLSAAFPPPSHARSLPSLTGSGLRRYLRCFLMLNRLSLSAFATTHTLDRLMAAAPNIGFISQPNSGIQAPAASGMPMTLYINAQNRFS